jgi:hypothetical protein
MPRQTVLLLLALGLAACSGEAPPEASAPPAPEAVVVESPPAEPAPAATPDPALTHFKGYGPARFGALEERVRMAWGQPMTGRTPIDLQNCHYLVPEARGVAVPDISFMIVDGQVARNDVRGKQYTAPGGVRVGMHADDVLAAFPGRVEEQMHKYVDGARYLIVAPEDGGETRLVFEADRLGRISTWRIGRPPAVFYVEGCA